MKKLIKNISSPIIKIENESISFNCGFWKSIGLLFLWVFITLILSSVVAVYISKLSLFFIFTLLSLVELLLIPLLSIILSSTFGKLTWQKNTFEKFNKKTFISLFLLIIAFRLVFDAFVYPVIDLIPNLSIYSSSDELLNKSAIIYFIISACIYAPIIEEVIFRGIMLGGLLNRYSPKVAILLSSFLFALMHGNLHQGINAFLLGTLIAYVYYKTKSIYLAIFCHFINNVTAFVVYIPTSLIGIILNIFISVLVCIPIYIYIKRNLSLHYEEQFISTLDSDKKIYYYREL